MFSTIIIFIILITRTIMIKLLLHVCFITCIIYFYITTCIIISVITVLFLYSVAVLSGGDTGVPGLYQDSTCRLRGVRSPSAQHQKVLSQVSYRSHTPLSHPIS